MNGTMTIQIKGASFVSDSNRSNIPRGALNLPDGFSINGILVAIGEDDKFLHCIASPSGNYFGISKEEEYNHLFQHILRLNQG